MIGTGALAGRTIVVTRAVERAGTLAAMLEAHGATVLAVATIAAADPHDGGAALRAALVDPDTYSLVVATSPEGVERVAAALVPHGVSVRLAVVGPGSATRAYELGLHVEVVAQEAHGQSLVDAVGQGDGRVLVAQGDLAAATVVDGLTANGWKVNAVTAYRTVPVMVSDEQRVMCQTADAITFASGSAVTNFVRVAGVESVPPCVVCIGPTTLAAALEAGITGCVMADPHTLDGLVAVTIAHLAR
jgi:uroporphyrinogen III methyltransferase / synthase